MYTHTHIANHVHSHTHVKPEHECAARTANKSAVSSKACSCKFMKGLLSLQSAGPWKHTLSLSFFKFNKKNTPSFNLPKNALLLRGSGQCGTPGKQKPLIWCTLSASSHPGKKKENPSPLRSFPRAPNSKLGSQCPPSPPSQRYHSNTNGYSHRKSCAAP